MASAERIVRVSIDLRNRGIRQQSFSDLLLLAEHRGPNRVEVVTGADEVLELPGVTQSSPLYRAALSAFSQAPGVFQAFVGRRDAGETATESLAAARIADDGWYGFADVTRNEAEAIEIADWAEASGKLYLLGLSDLTSTVLASRLAAEGYNRTSWWYHPDRGEFPEIAVAANRFTKLPGSESWANVVLSGVSATPLSETLSRSIRDFNGNTYEPVRNLNITQYGRCASAQHVDTIRFRDWLCEEIRTRVLLAKVNADKIPFTDAGIGIIRQAMISALDQGVEQGGIARPETDPVTGKLVPSYTTSVPYSIQVSSADKAARVLRDVRFTAREAGAIHNSEIRGALTFGAI